jgi:hypothetical protein
MDIGPAVGPTNRPAVFSAKNWMPPSGGSRDRTKSPPIVSAKREYSISVTWAEQRSAAGQIIPKAQKGESCADLRQVVAMLADIELVAFHVGPIACRPLRHAEGY